MHTHTQNSLAPAWNQANQTCHQSAHTVRNGHIHIFHTIIVKSVPPSHPAVPIQCHCGQLVPTSSNQMFCSILSQHTLSSFISQFFSLPFSFPRQFFFMFHIFIGDEDITMRKGGTCVRGSEGLEVVWCCFVVSLDRLSGFALFSNPFHLSSPASCTTEPARQHPALLQRHGRS